MNIAETTALCAPYLVGNHRLSISGNVLNAYRFPNLCWHVALLHVKFVPANLFFSIKDNPIQATSEHLPETTRPVRTKSVKTFFNTWTLRLESCWNFNASVSQSGIRFHLPLPPFPHASSQTFEPRSLLFFWSRGSMTRGFK